MPNPLSSSQRSQIDGAQPASGQLLSTNSQQTAQDPSPDSSPQQTEPSSASSQRMLPLAPPQAAKCLAFWPGNRARTRPRAVRTGSELVSGRSKAHSVVAQRSSSRPVAGKPTSMRADSSKTTAARLTKPARRHRDRRLVDRSERETKRAGRSKSAPSPTPNRVHTSEPDGTDGPTERKASTSKQEEKNTKKTADLRLHGREARERPGGAAEREPRACCCCCCAWSAAHPSRSRRGVERNL